MRRGSAIVLAAILGLGSREAAAQEPPAHESPAPLEVHIAPGGSDANPGTVARPLRTLEGARDTLRTLAGDGSKRQPVTVWLHAGDYERARSFVLGPEDSGTPDAPVSYRARPGEVVRLLGGRTVPAAAFEPVPAGPQAERLDPTARAHVLAADLRALGITDFGDPTDAGRRLELFFDDVPMTLARWPNEGFVTIEAVCETEPLVAHGIRGDRVGRFRIEGDRPRRWIGEIEHARLHGYWFWDWSESYESIESIDADTLEIRLAPPYHHYGYRKGQRFYALNLLGELDRPGEWYLDREAGRLYFWPPAPPSTGRIVVSILEDPLVVMRGVSHVELRGVVLEATRGTAVTIEGGRGNRIAGCVIRNTGAGGVAIRSGEGHGVSGCDLHRLGSVAVTLEGGDRPTLTPAGNFAANNDIRDFGRLKRTYSGAIHLAGVGNRASNNRIHDAPHLAILFGGNENVMERNEIHDVCRETGDVGVFYTGRDWTVRGNVIRHNYIHDVHGPGALGAQVVYLDDAASGSLVFGNIIVRSSRAMLIGGGRDNRIENNVIVDCPESIRIDDRGLNWMKGHVGPGGIMRERLAALPTREEPWASRYPELVGILENDPGAPRGNIVQRNAIVRSGAMSFAASVVEHGTIENNRTSDAAPVFADETGGNLRLREGPIRIREIPGFEPIPADAIGLRDDAHRRSLPPLR